MEYSDNLFCKNLLNAWRCQ